LKVDVDHDQLDCIVDRGGYEYHEEVVEEGGEENIAQYVDVDDEGAAAWHDFELLYLFICRFIASVSIAETWTVKIAEYPAYNWSANDEDKNAFLGS